MRNKFTTLMASVFLAFVSGSSIAAQPVDYELAQVEDGQLLKIGGTAYRISAFSKGGDHVCFITEMGLAMCFGQNEHGQLGDGTTVNRQHPVPVAGLGIGVKMIKASKGYTCAVNAQSEALCFGLNNRAQLGSHGKENQLHPAKVEGINSPVVDMEPSATRVCVDLENDETICWGDDFS